MAATDSLQSKLSPRWHLPATSRRKNLHNRRGRGSFNGNQKGAAMLVKLTKTYETRVIYRTFVRAEAVAATKAKVDADDKAAGLVGVWAEEFEPQTRDPQLTSHA